MKIDSMKPSKYVKKEDVEPPVVVTIDRLDEENVAMENQPPEYKWVMSFKEAINPLVLNWTNIQLCAAIHGDETDNWIGKKVVLWNDKSVSFGGKLTGGVRIRAAEAPQPARRVDERNPTPIEEDPNDQIPF